MGAFSGLAAGIKPVLNFKVEGSSGAVNDMATTMVQKFWDSALALDPPEDDYDTQSDQDHPQFLCEDDEGNKFLLTTDSDLAGAISHARTTGLKFLHHLGRIYDTKRRRLLYGCSLEHSWLYLAFFV
ncbi:hypothetical protein MKW98_029543 [Papaver atlanticum]|uniref:PB1 domain-containing protein n=1 Tax=Papaver atlanticum TaxID=357466 RepID=A0AAD4S441_9MAGN|nr:hypothetical protein MKW98_029543 [Papaver atlanticum]